MWYNLGTGKSESNWWDEARGDKSEAENQNWWDQPQEAAEVAPAQRSPEVKRQQHKTWLWAQNNASEFFPNSDGPENTHLNDPAYAELGDKVHGPYVRKAGDGFKHYPKHETGKFDRFENLSLDVSYKLRLNVPPEHLQFVAQYLIDEGYYFKYLSGGAHLSGEIFTVYIGSLDLTRKLAGELSEALRGRLCKPINKREVEFAPNVSGYFKATHDGLDETDRSGHADFLRTMDDYPTCDVRGFNTLKKFEDVQREQAGGRWDYWEAPVQPAAKRMAFDESHEVLSDRFGEFFYGRGA